MPKRKFGSIGYESAGGRQSSQGPFKKHKQQQQQQRRQSSQSNVHSQTPFTAIDAQATPGPAADTGTPWRASAIPQVLGQPGFLEAPPGLSANQRKRWRTRQRLTGEAVSSPGVSTQVAAIPMPSGPSFKAPEMRRTSMAHSTPSLGCPDPPKSVAIQRAQRVSGKPVKPVAPDMLRQATTTKLLVPPMKRWIDDEPETVELAKGDPPALADKGCQTDISGQMHPMHVQLIFAPLPLLSEAPPPQQQSGIKRSAKTAAGSAAVTQRRTASPPSHVAGENDMIPNTALLAISSGVGQAREPAAEQTLDLVPDAPKQITTAASVDDSDSDSTEGSTNEGSDESSESSSDDDEAADLAMVADEGELAVTQTWMETDEKLRTTQADCPNDLVSDIPIPEVPIAPSREPQAARRLNNNVDLKPRSDENEGDEDEGASTEKSDDERDEGSADESSDDGDVVEPPGGQTGSELEAPAASTDGALEHVDPIRQDMPDVEYASTPPIETSIVRKAEVDLESTSSARRTPLFAGINTNTAALRLYSGRFSSTSRQSIVKKTEARAATTQVADARAAFKRFSDFVGGDDSSEDEDERSDSESESQDENSDRQKQATDSAASISVKPVLDGAANDAAEMEVPGTSLEQDRSSDGDPEIAIEGGLEEAAAITTSFSKPSLGLSWRATKVEAASFRPSMSIQEINNARASQQLEEEAQAASQTVQVSSEPGGGKPTEQLRSGAHSTSQPRVESSEEDEDSASDQEDSDEDVDERAEDVDESNEEDVPRTDNSKASKPTPAGPEDATEDLLPRVIAPGAAESSEESVGEGSEDEDSDDDEPDEGEEAIADATMNALAAATPSRQHSATKSVSDVKDSPVESETVPSAIDTRYVSDGYSEDDDDMEDIPARSSRTSAPSETTPSRQEASASQTSFSASSSQIQPSTKVQSSFLGLRSGGSGSGRARSNEADDTDTPTKDLTFTDADDDDVYKTIDEITSDVFSATRPLPADKDEEDSLMTSACDDRDLKSQIVRRRLVKDVDEATPEPQAQASGWTPINHSPNKDCDYECADTRSLLLLLDKVKSSSLSELGTTPSPPLSLAAEPEAIVRKRLSETDVQGIPLDDAEFEPLAAKKRRMTGNTSKHWSPEKRTKRQRSQEVAAQSIEQAVDDAGNAQDDEQSLTLADAVVETSGKPAKKRKSTATKSPHFERTHLFDRVDLPSPNRRRVPTGVSSAPVPPITSEYFGIIQEKLWDQPFWLLIAVTFLNKTTGRAAAPTFWDIKNCYETPEALAEADFDDVLDAIHHLGLQYQRADRIIKMAKAWVALQPVAGKRYRTTNYPKHADHREYNKMDVVEVDAVDCKGALEIGYIPGCGAYAWDSWRIFCRDVLRGVAEDYNAKGAEEEDFEPEWKRVLPLDKELRATLRWMWLREGWIWNHETGEKRRATEEEMGRAVQGEMDVPDEEKKFAAEAAGVTEAKSPVVVNDRDGDAKEEAEEDAEKQAEELEPEGDAKGDGEEDGEIDGEREDLKAAMTADVVKDSQSAEQAQGSISFTDMAKSRREPSGSDAEVELAPPPKKKGKGGLPAEGRPTADTKKTLVDQGPKRKAVRSEAWTEEDWQKVLRLHDEGKSAKEIGEALGIGYDRIRKKLRRKLGSSKQKVFTTPHKDKKASSPMSEPLV